MRLTVAAGVAAVLALQAGDVCAETAAETAAAFGARDAVQEMALSPNGSQIAFVAPAAAGQGATLYTLALDGTSQPRATLSVPGTPDRLRNCNWVSESRLVCSLFGLVKSPEWTLPIDYRRKVAVDVGGGHQMFLTRQTMNAHFALLDGGRVVDWLPGHDGSVLMTKQYQRNDVTGTLIGQTREGLGLDRVDTVSGAHVTVITPKTDAVDYISDGNGTVRLIAFGGLSHTTYQDSGVVQYQVLGPNGQGARPFASFDNNDNSGFLPLGVDAAKNVAYGLIKHFGRFALYSKPLDGGEETLVFSRPDVDVDELVQVGRNNRIVGVSYATDRRYVEYFDPEIAALRNALGRALPGAPLVDIADASVDESKLLVIARSDVDAGRYYLLDRKTKKMQLLMAARPELEGRKLAAVKSVTYRTADGTQIPAYLTLPPDGAGKNIPAIVMPHGGPSSRDEWGFDWLAQFFAARGYAVLQPEFRGSSGFGDAWFRDKGFKQWKVAIGDVTDAGKWLVAQGIADPAKLAVFGWSYGGYAALQSAVSDPGLFKAVVAVAPVTDLAMLGEETRNFSNYRFTANFIGSGPHVVEGSPAQNAARIKAPVLMFHGTLDANVGYRESVLMQDRLRAAGKKVDLVTFDGLDHHLEDSAARRQMLQRSDEFIRNAFELWKQAGE